MAPDFCGAGRSWTHPPLMFAIGSAPFNGDADHLAVGGRRPLKATSRRRVTIPLTSSQLPRIRRRHSSSASLGQYCRLREGVGLGSARDEVSPAHRPPKRHGLVRGSDGLRHEPNNIMLRQDGPLVACVERGHTRETGQCLAGCGAPPGRRNFKTWAGSTA